MVIFSLSYIIDILNVSLKQYNFYKTSAMDMHEDFIVGWHLI